MTSQGEEHLRADLELYNQTQLQQITSSISSGILINKGLYYWAFQLERYRRNYSPSTLFSAAAYFWLFLGTLAALTLVNQALLKLDPSQFTTNGDPSLLAVTMYSFATLFVQEGGGISASGDWAYGIQLAAAFAGPVLLFTFILNFFVTYRRERDETALKELVDELKETAREQERRFTAEWSVGVDEAQERLEALGAGLNFIVRWITASVPAEFYDEQARPR